MLRVLRSSCGFHSARLAPALAVEFAEPSFNFGSLRRAGSTGELYRHFHLSPTGTMASTRADANHEQEVNDGSLATTPPSGQALARRDGLQLLPGPAVAGDGPTSMQNEGSVQGPRVPVPRTVVEIGNFAIDHKQRVCFAVHDAQQRIKWRVCGRDVAGRDQEAPGSYTRTPEHAYDEEDLFYMLQNGFTPLSISRGAPRRELPRFVETPASIAQPSMRNLVLAPTPSRANYRAQSQSTVHSVISGTNSAFSTHPSFGTFGSEESSYMVIERTYETQRAVIPTPRSVEHLPLTPALPVVSPTNTTWAIEDEFAHLEPVVNSSSNVVDVSQESVAILAQLGSSPAARTTSSTVKKSPIRVAVGSLDEHHNVFGSHLRSNSPATGFSLPTTSLTNEPGQTEPGQQGAKRVGTPDSHTVPQSISTDKAEKDLQAENTC